MTDLADECGLAMNRYAVRASVWCASMAKSPPEPVILLVRDMVYDGKFFEYMMEHTEVVRDLISSLGRNDSKYLDIVLALFDKEYCRRFPRLITQRADGALMETLWLKCIDFVTRPMPDDHRRLHLLAAHTLAHACPLIQSSWRTSIFALSAWIVGEIKSHQKHQGVDYVRLVTLLLRLIEYTPHQDTLDLCLQSNLFVSLNAWRTKDLGGAYKHMVIQTPQSSIFSQSWIPRLTTLVTTQFYYNLRRLATTLCPLNLPVLQLLAITDVALPNTEPMHRKWRVLAHIKHFRPSSNQ